MKKMMVEIKTKILFAILLAFPVQAIPGTPPPPPLEMIQIPIPKVFPPGFFAPDSLSINTRPAILEFPKPVTGILSEEKKEVTLEFSANDSQNEENAGMEPEEEIEEEEVASDPSEDGELAERSDVHVTVEFHEHSEDENLSGVEEEDHEVVEGDLEEESEVEEEEEEDQTEIQGEIMEDQTEDGELAERSDVHVTVEFHEHSEDEDQSEVVEGDHEDQSEIEEEVEEDQSEIEGGEVMEMEEEDEGEVNVAIDRVDPVTNLIKSPKIALLGAKQIAKGKLKIDASKAVGKLSAKAIKHTAKIISKVLPGGLPPI